MEEMRREGEGGGGRRGVGLEGDVKFVKREVSKDWCRGD